MEPLRVPLDEADLSDDALTVLWEGVPLNGIAFEEDDAGVLRSEATYRDGQRFGPAREWNADGVLILEAEFAFDSYHGPQTQWHPNGVTKQQATYEFGILVHSQDFDRDGHPAGEYRLAPGDPQAHTLELLREGSLARALKNQS